MTRCLVIEDSEMVRRVMTRVLEGLGIEVIEAEGAASALEAYKNSKPDIVFMDWDLPNIGALDFLREIANADRPDKPPMVLCATENDPRQIALAKAVGVEYHILKPFEPSAIKAALRKAGIVTKIPEGMVAVSG